ncbi:MAG: MAPEG family protein [Gammaproteobacteria bacterium]|nr:MAPEG family protein [Gammaproteobacteria bacterium]
MSFEQVVFPQVTFFYFAMLVFLYFHLTLGVTTLRAIKKREFGANDNRMDMAVRAHAQFFEYAPIITLMVAGLEMSGVERTSIHWLMGILLLGRFSHCAAFWLPQHSIAYWTGRAIGNVSNLGLLITSSVWGIARFMPAGISG